MIILCGIHWIFSPPFIGHFCCLSALSPQSCSPREALPEDKPPDGIDQWIVKACKPLQYAKVTILVAIFMNRYQGVAMVTKTSLIRGWEMTCLLSADDVILLSWSSHVLQHVLEWFDIKCEVVRTFCQVWRATATFTRKSSWKMRCDEQPQICDHF